MAQVRKVSKQWAKLVDENRQFWRVVELPKIGITKEGSSEDGPLEKIQSAVDQFDKMSGSTLEEVSISLQFKLITDVRQLQKVIEMLQKSERTLLSLEIKVQDDLAFQSDHFHVLKDSLLSFPNLVQCKLVLPFVYVKLLSKSRPRAGHMQVLWISGLETPKLGYLPSSRSDLFNKLTSLSVMHVNTGHSEWRRILSPSSQSLKHLRANPRDEQGGAGEIEPLHFPNLEVLEIFSGELQFPAWMVVPPTLKLYTEQIMTRLPPVSDLWMEFIQHNYWDISTRCPNLRVLRIEDPLCRYKLLRLLRERAANVEAGEKVGEVKMTKLEKLVVPPSMFSANDLEVCKDLVGQVVKWNSELTSWEVEM